MSASVISQSSFHSRNRLCRSQLQNASARELFIDNLLVRIHLIIVMIRWTGLAPWEFEFSVPGKENASSVGAQALLQAEGVCLHPVRRIQVALPLLARGILILLVKPLANRKS